MKTSSLLMVVAVLALGLVGGVQADTLSVTTADGFGADVDVFENIPDDTSSPSREYLQLRSYLSVDETVMRHNVPFLRFDVSSFPTATNATLTLHFLQTRTIDVDVFGVVDGVNGEADWSADTLTYNTAPGFSSGNSDPDRDHASEETVLLGTVSVTTSGSYSLSNTALRDFVNNDANGVVTFILEPQVAAAGDDFKNNISSAETNAPSQRPQLSVSGDFSSSISFTGSQTTVTTDKDDGSGITDIDIDALGTSDWTCWQNAIGAPTQQKAGASFIGDLREIGTPGGPNSWEFTSFTWPSGGDPLAVSSSPGFPAGVSSDSSVDAGEGYSIAIDLPGRSGTITFWGVSRASGATNDLSVTYAGSDIYTDSYTIGLNWCVTTFTLNWDGAEAGDPVTLKFTHSGGSGSPRVGLTGIAVSQIFAGTVVSIK